MKIAIIASITKHSRWRIFLLFWAIHSLLCGSLFADPELRAKIGQMLMVSFSGTVLNDSLYQDLAERNLGGVILMGRNAGYNLIGQQVKILATGVFSAGAHRLVFEAGDLTTGIFWLHVRMDGMVNNHKMILIK